MLFSIKFWTTFCYFVFFAVIQRVIIISRALAFRNFPVVQYWVKIYRHNSNWRQVHGFGVQYSSSSRHLGMSEPPLVFEKRNQNCSCILTALLLTATQEQDGRNDLRLINLGVCAVLFQNSLQKWATQLGYTTQTLLFIEFTPCWIGRKRSYNLYFRCLNAKPEIIKSIEFYKYVYVP